MLRFYLSCSALLLLSIDASAISPVNTGWLGNKAIKGFDPVAYFTEGKPVKGQKAFSWTWMNATWLFSSERNLQLFKNSPESFAPQFGGYCAWAVSQNSIAGVDPKAWNIVDGKLYLNYSRKIQNRWMKDMKVLIEEGNKFWPGLQN